MAAMAAPPRTGAAVMTGAKPAELAEVAPPELPDEAAEPARDEALDPALLAAPLREEAALDKLEAMALPAVKRVVEPMVDVVTALLPEEMVVTMALVV